MNWRAFSKWTAAALFSSAMVLGSTITSTWIGGPGSWSTAADWIPATVPNNGAGNTYNVTIASSAPGGDLVTLDSTPAIDSLVLGGASTSSVLLDQGINAHTLTISGPLTINGNGGLSLNSSTVNIGASSSNAGSLILGAGGPPLAQTASTVNVSGDLTNRGNIAVSVGIPSPGITAPTSTLNVTGTLINHGGLHVEGASPDPQNLHPTFIGGTATLGGLVNTGSIGIDPGATLSVANGITDLPSGSSMTVFGKVNSGGTNALAGLTSIAGALQLQNTQSTAITPDGGTLTVSGTVGIDAVPAPIGPSMTPSSATINGALVLSGSGHVETSGGSSLTVTNGITDVPAGTVLSLGGPANFGGANAMVGLTNIAGSLFLGSFVTITPNGGTLTVSGDLSVSPPYRSALGGAAIVEGALVVANGGAISIGSLGSTVQATVDFVNNGTVTMTAGGHVYSPRTLNNGSFTIGNAGFVTTDFTNAVGGTLTLGGSIIRTEPNYPNGPFINAGILAEQIFGVPANNSTCTGSNDCGFIDVAQSATLSGTLEPILENGFDPVNGQSFIFLTAGNVIGQFSSIENLTFNNNTQYWVVTYGSNYVELTAAAVPEPATLLLFAVGLGAVALLRKRNSRSK